MILCQVNIIDDRTSLNKNIMIYLIIISYLHLTRLIYTTWLLEWKKCHDMLCLHLTGLNDNFIELLNRSNTRRLNENDISGTGLWLFSPCLVNLVQVSFGSADNKYWRTGSAIGRKKVIENRARDSRAVKIYQTWLFPGERMPIRIFEFHVPR